MSQTNQTWSILALRKDNNGYIANWSNDKGKIIATAWIKAENMGEASIIAQDLWNNHRHIIQTSEEI